MQSSLQTATMTSAIRLTAISDLSDTAVLRPTSLTDERTGSNRTLPTDTVMEASRIADDGAPEGGYGWVVVASSSLMTFWFIGTPYSWGVIQNALVEQGLSKPSTLAFVGSVTAAFISAFGIINGRLIRAIGPRNVAFLGMMLMSLGQILSGWTLKSVAGLFITVGCVMGYGVSCCFMVRGMFLTLVYGSDNEQQVVSVVPAQYFRKRRGLANGLVYAGGGLGGAVISLSMSAIIKKLGIAWTFRLIGIMMLASGLPAAWCIKERSPVTTTAFIEWRLFRDSKFAVLFAAGTIGYTAQVGAVLVAAFNFSSAIGRILCGLLGDKLGPINSLLVSLLLSAVSMLALWPVSTSIAPLGLFVFINGMGNGGFFAIMPTVVGNTFGSTRVAIAMGMIVTGWTGGYLLGAPIAGYILDSYGGEQGGFKSYRPAIFYAGSMAAGAAGLVAYVRLRMSKRLWAKC